MAQNISEFHIIGRIGKIETGEKVTHVDVAANYNRKNDQNEWETDTHWNRVTAFKKNAERASSAAKGDLVRVTGRVRQNRYETNGETRYSVDLIADSFSVIVKAKDSNDS